MELFEALYQRQSIPKVRQDPLPRELIERLLDAAVQAPNHHRNRPWRFVVLSGRAREHLGDLAARGLASRKPDSTPAALEAERMKPLRAPLIIAVGIDHADPLKEPKIKEIENICAGAAAVENLLLAAHALGLGAIWRTGAATLYPEVKAWLGFQPAQHILAFVYLGYPDGELHPTARPDSRDRTTWIED